MSGHDELDEKLARLAGRVHARSEDTRAKLEALGCDQLARQLRDAFGAKLAYLGPDAGFAHGHAYDFELGTGPETVLRLGRGSVGNAP
jgi:hypothetical protein